MLVVAFVATKKLSPTPHDALFKWMFSVPERAAEELRAVLSSELSSTLQWKTLRLEPGEFVDRRLRRSYSDLLFSVRARSRRALLYLLFEHRSTPDPLMPLRTLLYMGRVWTRWMREHPGARKVPPIVPVVLHHGAGGWRAGPDLHDVFDADEALFAAAHPYLPALRPQIDDLSEQADSELQARVDSAVVKLALLAMKHGRTSADIDERLRRWGRLVREVADSSYGIEALTTVVRYLFEESPHLSRKRVAGVLRSETKSKAEAIMGTIGERLIAQGRKEGKKAGIAEGKKAGIAEGALRGRCEFLLGLLRQRFGTLPEEIVARVSGATDTAMLDQWGAQVIVAASLAEIFDGGESRRPRRDARTDAKRRPRSPARR